MKFPDLHNNFKAIVIGGSAGSFQGITRILSQVPKDFPLPIIMCLHRLKHVRNGFIEALAIKSIKDNSFERLGMYKKGETYNVYYHYYGTCLDDWDTQLVSDLDKLDTILRLLVDNSNGTPTGTYSRMAGGIEGLDERAATSIYTLIEATLERANNSLKHIYKLPDHNGWSDRELMSIQEIIDLKKCKNIIDLRIKLSEVKVIQEQEAS